MMNMEAKHWTILAALFVAIGTQLSGLEHGFADAASPAFVGGLLVQIGTTVAALFVGVPHKPYDGVDRRKRGEGDEKV